MKKTMLTLMATVGLAFGAKADGLTAYEGSTAFETAAFVVDGTLPGNDEGALTTGGTAAFWSGSTSESKVVAGGSSTVEYYKSGAHAKYASLDTGSDVLLRQAIAGGTVNFGSIYFDTMVQFTASDGDVDPAEGDKLIVWLKATEAEGEPGDEDYVPAATNLMITAGELNEEFYATGARTYTVTGTVAGPANYQAGEWYRLTVKTYANIGLEATVPGFRVFIDGSEVTVTGADLYNGHFASMVSRAVGTQTLTGIGFQGTGAVDDIAMTHEDPIPEVAPTTVALTVALTDDDGVFNSLTAQVGDAVAADVVVPGPAPIVAAVDNVITFVAKVYDGYTPTVTGYDVDKSDDPIAIDDEQGYAYTFTVTVTQAMIDDGLTLTINVTKNGGGSDEDVTEIGPDGTATIKDKEGYTEETVAAMVTVQAPNNDSLTDDQKTAYDGYFTKTANKVGETWSVTAELDEKKLEDDVDDAVEAALEAVVGDAEKKAVAIPAGFYYKIEHGATVGLTGEPLTGTSTGSVAMPALGENAGFFKVSVDTATFEE